MQKNWAKIQEILENVLSPGQFKVWISPLEPAVEGDTLVLLAQNAFVADFVRRRFSGMIEEAASAVAGRPCRIALRVAPAAGAAPAALSAASLRAEDTPEPRGLPAALTETRIDIPPARSVAEPRPLPRAITASQMPLPLSLTSRPAHTHAWRYAFEDFVVGPCNELAFAASRSVCGMGKSADTLFLSSAPGLGKTHLMQAAGRMLCEDCNRSAPRVEYLTAEEFASRFFLALKSSDTEHFKARYRDVDMLLLEDVHFLQGKEKMQAEFLATIKAVRERGGKILCTGSFAPLELRQMDEQLVSRLSSGLLAAIERPDEETRKRILRYKAKAHQVLLPTEVEETLARHIHADVRRIESCLQTLILKAQLCHSGITMQMAWEVLSSYAAHSPVLDLESIIQQVCRCFDLSVEQLFSARRRQDYVSARNTAFFLARKHTDLSLEAIGRRFNRRHSTVLKGITRLEQEMSRETPLGRQIAGAVSLIEKNGNIVVLNV